MKNENWRKRLSYLFPLTKHVESEVSGRLEIEWIDGKKVLNCRQVNYSYGGLQKALSYGLSQISLEGVSSALVMGMGGGSVVKTLRDEFQYVKDITAVELDPVVIEIAKTEFGIDKVKNFEIICSDAAEFIENTALSFDLIIVDLFIGRFVPEKFYAKAFWQNIEKKTNPNARIVFNAGIQLSDLVRDRFLEDLPKTFTYAIHTEVMGNNTLILVHKTA